MAKTFVANEAGHTSYPKWVDHPTQKESFKTQDGKEIPKRVLVNNPDEEKDLGNVKVGKDFKNIDPNKQAVNNDGPMPANTPNAPGWAAPNK